MAVKESNSLDSMCSYLMCGSVIFQLESVVSHTNLEYGERRKFCGNVVYLFLICNFIFA
jgi:hypothetical protein